MTEPKAGEGVTGAGLSVRDLVVRYGDVVAVDGLDLRARPGSVLAVTGHSGAGKTSLLWALAGLTPCEGEVRIGAHSLIPQGSALSSVLSAQEAVAVPLLQLGLNGPEAADAARAALRDVGLEESGSHLPDELSGGQQQRVAAARGIARTRALLDHGPAVLLADEPTSELDHDNRERVVALLRDLAEAGACVVVTTHDPEVAAAADDSISLDS